MTTTEDAVKIAAEFRAGFATDTQKPYLNVGCGRVILPAEKPAHHGYIPDGVHRYPKWVNADKVKNDGVDVVADLFTYPWPFEDNSFDGAIISHVLEHVPHEIKTAYRPNVTPDTHAGDAQFEALRKKIHAMQDGFFAFFYELWRVLTPGSIAHIIAPYGMATTAFIDPTHTRHLFPHTFAYLMPEDSAPFEYNIGEQAWRYGGQVQIGYSAIAEQMLNADIAVKDADAFWQKVGLEAYRQRRMQHLTDIHWNMITEFYIPLQAVK